MPSLCVIAAKTPWSPLKEFLERRAGTSNLEGLIAAARHCGFDVRQLWESDAPLEYLEYPEGYKSWESEESPATLAKIAKEHEEKHGIPFEQWVGDFKPQVSVQAGHDGKLTYDIEMVEDEAQQSPKPWTKRIRSWFSGSK